MGLFSRSKGATGPKDLRLTLTNIVILVFMTMIFIQAIGLLFPSTNIHLGPIFILVSVGLASWMGVAIFKKLMSGYPITLQDMTAVIIVAVIALVIVIYLRDLVPEVFEQSIVQLQSVLGM